MQASDSEYPFRYPFWPNITKMSAWFTFLHEAIERDKEDYSLSYTSRCSAINILLINILLRQIT